MAGETVTLPRETLETIRSALHAAIEATVAATYLCELNDDGLEHGAVCALKVCVAKAEDGICDSAKLLADTLEVPHG
jgi:hypothetical protein